MPMLLFVSKTVALLSRWFYIPLVCHDSLLKETCENAATLIAVGWSAQLPLKAFDKTLITVSAGSFVSGRKDFFT